MTDPACGILVACGRGGELGDINRDDNQFELRVVDSLEGASIVDISCGGKHSLCLSAKGEVCFQNKAIKISVQNLIHTMTPLGFRVWLELGWSIG